MRLQRPLTFWMKLWLSHFICSSSKTRSPFSSFTQLMGWKTYSLPGWTICREMQGKRGSDFNINQHQSCKLFPTPASMISKEALIALSNLILPSKIDVFARHLVQFCIQRIPHLSHFGMLLSANSSFTASSTSSEAWVSMKRHFENPRLHAFLQHRKNAWIASALAP